MNFNKKCHQILVNNSVLAGASEGLGRGNQSHQEIEQVLGSRSEDLLTPRRKRFRKGKVT